MPQSLHREKLQSNRPAEVEQLCNCRLDDTAPRGTSIVRMREPLDLTAMTFVIPRLNRSRLSCSEVHAYGALEQPPGNNNDHVCCCARTRLRSRDFSLCADNIRCR
jgi:hypothetical protein